MKKIISLLVLLAITSYAYTTTINIPADYSTIQAGIDVAVDGDSILVQPGTYVENINYNGKNITVGSLFLTTQNTIYISQTIIDGDSLSTVVLFNSGEDSTAILCGFTITNGYGSWVDADDFPLGGGISCEFSNPTLKNLIIENNSALENGGGIFCCYSSPSLANVTISNNSAGNDGGGIYCNWDSSPSFSSENRCNIYSNNTTGRGSGADIFSYECDMINVIVDTFTVMNPTDYHASPLDNFTFDILNAVNPQVDADLYVSPDGDNSNDGLTAETPLKTIQYATSIILADSLNPYTIHLANGIYSSSTNGEFFPVDVINYVSLVGESEDGVILDAEGVVGVMKCRYVTSSTISHLTLTNGFAQGDYPNNCGGGIYCDNSSPSLANVTLSNNSASDGGGIYCYYSSPSLENVTITDNSANSRGGGIYCRDNSSPSLENVTITNNSAGYSGGGICCVQSSPILTNVTITNNSANDDGGGIYCVWNSSPSFVNCILWNDAPQEVYVSSGSVNISYSDIQGGYSGEGNIDLDPLFVDAENGDFHLQEGSPCINAGDPNSPLDPDGTIADMGAYYYYHINHIINIPEDYTTIQAGIEIAINGDTILVQPGTYVENINYNSKNITVASLFLTTQDTSYISQTIIDGNQSGSVVTFVNGEDSTSILTGFKITNGSADIGGGINCNYSSPILKNLIIINNCAADTTWSTGGGIGCHHSSPTLENLKISNNIASYYGGGIYCYSNSSPSLENVTITGNSTEWSGGGMYCRENSSPSLVDVTISGNSASDYGGGIYCYSSSPTLTNLTITNNSADDGGGIYCYSNSSPSLVDVTISNNSASENGGGIYCYYSSPSFSSENRCNIYSNNTTGRGSGADIYSYECDMISVIVDTFTVMIPTEYHASPLDNFTFDILNAVNTQVDADLYVSPAGDNSNDGLTAEFPLKTIQYATSIILADSLNPHTIHLANGIYSPSTNGEFFPVEVINYVSLAGESEEGVILDAEGVVGVMKCRYVTSATISHLTLTNGFAQGDYPNNCGGGIYLKDSSPSLADVTISGNSASYYGGGISCNDSSPSLANVTITNNSADDGGGISCFSSSPTLTNVTITNNTAGSYGGGIWCGYNSSPSLENVTISDNSASYDGGGIYCRSSSSPSLVNCILWNDAPQEVCFYESSSSNSIMIAYSDIQGGEAGIVTNDNGTVYWEDGNIDLDPLFVDAATGDFHLQESSPCIDAGDPNSPLDPDGTRADMGAYYYQVPPNAEFTSAVTEGYSPLDVNFTDLSSGNLITWEWDFQDDGTIDSYEQNPSFTYTEAGLYTVSLTVTDENGLTDTELKEDYITVYEGNTIDGYAYLDGEDVNSGIKVLFERVAPSTYVDSIFSDSTGYYIIGLPNGLYDITYSKDEYYPLPLEGEALYSNTTLEEIILYSYILIPRDYQTIQEGIDNCLEGDTVLVDTGTYFENINFNGKNITVASLYLTTQDSSYISQTVIDGSSSGHVVEFSSGEDATAILSGFTIQNGYAQENWPNNSGGGIYCNYSSPTLTNVTITNNTIDFGGGISCYYSSPTLTNVTITNNTTSYGGGISCYNSSPSLVNVTLSGNSVSSSGGGIYCWSSSSPTLTNVTITNNSADDDGGGIYCYNNSSPNLLNTIVSGNEGNYGIYVDSGDPSIAYSNFYNNENGNFYNCGYVGINVMTNANGDSCDAYYNIQMDPLFVDATNGDFHLTEDSPCIDAGLDVGLPYYGIAPDMGAFEYNTVAADEEELQFITENSFISYPNPITAKTNEINISFSLKKSSRVNIKLYNIKGQMVDNITNNYKESGTHAISSNINNLSSGIYFIKMDVDGKNRAVKKIVLMK